MTDDATLSDFASAADEQDDDSGTDANADAASSADADAAPGADADTPSANAEDPAGETRLSTYAWGTYDCSRCDSETDRVWRSDGDLVCPDCKEW